VPGTIALGGVPGGVGTDGIPGGVMVAVGKLPGTGIVVVGDGTLGGVIGVVLVLVGGGKPATVAAGVPGAPGGGG